MLITNGREILVLVVVLEEEEMLIENMLAPMPLQEVVGILVVE